MIVNMRIFGLLQELMLDSAKTKNVIEATNKPHLFEKLEDLQKRFMHSFVFLKCHCTVFS